MGQRQSRNLPPIRVPAQSVAAFTADLPPLRFHRNHGDNIRLESDRSRAARVESFCKGICFTDRPVNVGERVCIRITEVSTRWSGVLRMGFSAHNPSTLGELPKYACPDLTNRQGFWGKALSGRVTEAGMTLHFYVTAGGDVHFGMDGQDEGVILTGVDTRQTLWGMIDLYGNCTAIEMVDMRRGLNNYSGGRNVVNAEVAAAIRREHHMQQPNHIYQHQLRQQQQQQQQFSMEQLHDGISALSIRPVVSDLPPPYAAPSYVPPPPPPPAPVVAPVPQVPNPASINPDELQYNRGVPFRRLHFHFCKGKNARLNGSNDVAWRDDSEFSQGYVFAAAPITLGERMVVQVLQTEVIANNTTMRLLNVQ